MEQELEQLSEQLPGALLVIVGGKIVYISRNIINHQNDGDQPLVGCPLVDLAQPDQAEIIERGLWECENLTSVDSNEFRTIDFLGRSIEEQEVWFEFRGKLGIWKDNPAIIGIISDMTHRKRLENKLRQSHRRQQVLITNMPALVYRCGRDHNQSMEYLSLETDKLTGYSFEELMGNDPISFEELIIASDRNLVKESIKSALEMKQAFEIDYRITTKDGEIKYVHEIGRAIQNDNGEFSGFVGMLFDVSEKVQTEDKLLQSERMVAMGEMASGVAHDFNNVLTGILGRAQLLQFREIPEDMLQDVQTIEKIAHNGAEVVRRIQVFTRSRSAANLTPVDMNSIIRDVVDLTRPRWYDQAKSHNVHIDMMTELNPIPRVKGNEAELREVLTNLIVNAIDAIRERGSIRILSEQIGDKISVTIKDDGVGIPSELHRKIFAPFFSSKGVNGTGLGLTVARKIVERHVGEITVDSVPGEGATFRIVFPVAKMLSETKENPKSDQVIEPAVIMVVDVDDNVRELMKDVLEKDGHEVYCFDNGIEAVASLPEIQPEIIISDISLPDTDGSEIVRQIRGSHPNVHIILSSGLDDHVYQEKMCDSQVELMIKKPFNIQQLRSVLFQARQSQTDSD